MRDPRSSKVPVCYLYRAPGRREASRNVRLHAVGQGREGGFQHPRTVAPQYHLGPVVQGRLVHGSEYSVPSAEREGRVCIRNPCDGLLAVLKFIGLEIAGYGPRHRMTLICEPELRQFVRHGQRIGLRQFVAKCYSVVECAEAEREGHAFIRLPHCDGHFVVTVAVPLVLAPGGCPQLVVGGVPYACYRRSLQRGSACRRGLSSTVTA